MASSDNCQPQIVDENVKSVVALGATELHQHVASRMRAALGRPLPQVEVRFENVSISASITVKDEAQAQTELPTIANVIKQSARQVGLDVTSSRKTSFATSVACLSQEQ
ncbi:uncharacterized protein PITG_01881 [Phytophthora infestans T30-4]|uniref:Uncharacterized protein n=1 Tax=Phytophthora infestans (strain T30-4) TaxID=403677 RepID=D0MUB5_PHYIT|nr:uncharacterized protein PITG_01881 [Phytophthora infestans T30-4]EEY61562.1 hypothetical protein PITG_01881 [Phytophthora infestans T30-4]|eukprot:XP_002908479.1 hypothetical protein PITG_01881 [Phytophthora infestans T30-4]